MEEEEQPEEGRKEGKEGRHKGIKERTGGGGGGREVKIYKMEEGKRERGKREETQIDKIEQ